MNGDPQELGEFLRSRRALVQPGDVGMPKGDRRRVPGLRREELAIAAGVSPDHYQRIEQGRVHPSPQVLQAIGRALGLTDVEQTHLLALAGRASAEDGGDPAAYVRAADMTVPDEVILLLEALSGVPAYVLNHRRDVLAWNPLGAALIADFGALPARERNVNRMMLLDPHMRERYVDWEASLRDSVAHLRHATGAYPHDPELMRLVGELTSRSSEFARLWAQREVLQKTYGAKRLRHPQVGELTLRYQILQVSGAAHLQVMVYLAADATARSALGRLSAMLSTGQRPRVAQDN